MQKNWFSSDAHYGHTNVLKYDNRDFSTIEEHDEALIAIHNKTVSKKDNWYYMGDFCFKDAAYAESIMKRLNGNKFFIKGNHDHKELITLYEKYGTYLGQLQEIKIEKQRIILCHFAMRVWNQNHRNSWHLYGHSHDAMETEVWGKSMDVGYPSTFRLFGEYRPIEFEEIKIIMNGRPSKIID